MKLAVMRVVAKMFRTQRHRNLNARVTTVTAKLAFVTVRQSMAISSLKSGPQKERFGSQSMRTSDFRNPTSILSCQRISLR